MIDVKGGCVTYPLRRMVMFIDKDNRWAEENHRKKSHYVECKKSTIHILMNRGNNMTNTYRGEVLNSHIEEQNKKKLSKKKDTQKGVLASPKPGVSKLWPGD